MGVLLRSWATGLSCCLAGVLIDLDHFLDLWLNRGFSLSPKKLLDFCYYGSSRKFYDILHGYEYVPLLAWASTVPGWSAIGWGVTVGYTLHLIGDQCYNTHLHPGTYFLSYRAYHRFESSRIVLHNPFLQAKPRR
jgi:hypothetical protein